MLRRLDLPPVWMALSGLTMLLIALWTPWRFDADLWGWLAMLLGAGAIFLAAPQFLLAATPTIRTSC